MILFIRRKLPAVGATRSRGGAALLVAAITAIPAAAQSQVWLKQVGSSFSDTGTIAPDGAGGIFVGGMASASLAGPSQGSIDAWLGRYDGAGNQLWISQFGTITHDELTALAPDGAAGVYVGGFTGASMFGPHAGGYDAWLQRRNAAGTILWSRQLGTFGDDGTFALVGDGAGGVLAGGTTIGSLGGPFGGGIYSDAWVARYDAAGNQLWITQFGTTLREDVYAIAGDGSGGAFVAGTTWGSLGGQSAGWQDAWFARVDGTGTLAWIRQLGTPGEEAARGAVADGSGGVLLCGWTNRSLFGPSAGGLDAWVARFDGGGNTIWSRQLGTGADDDACAVALDGAGGGYLTGTTNGTLGTTHAGQYDVWFERFDPAGTPLWVHQFGSIGSERPSSIVANGPAAVFLAGQTTWDLGGTNAGASDAWFGLFDVPCPGGSSYCVASATSIPGCQASTSASGLPSLADPTSFTISSGNIPGGNVGIGIFGANGKASLPVGTLGGSICFAPPLYRTKMKSGGGTTSACDGSLQVTLQDLVLAAPVVVPGATVLVEFWARDPANPDGFLLSNGFEFLVCP